jgi:hypothetical protein
MQDVKKLEGYEEIMRKFANSLTPELALGGMSRAKLEGHEEAVTRFLKELPVEQRFADLSPEQRLLAMPDDALRALSDDYLGGLSADVQSAIRKRIGRPSA